jgi:formylglycine-generating enzyme required for sulfatase activity
MKTLLITLTLLGGLLATSVSSLHAQETRFFRIVGPVATTIMDVTMDGTVTWTNVAINATFTVQTATVLPDATNWVDWVQVPVTNAVTVHRLFDPKPPPGMAFIPAGSFMMGDTFNDSHDSLGERPTHTVYVSAFYMDKYEVTKALWDEVYQWAIAHGYRFEYGAQGKAYNHPAHTMTWYDAVKWCNARSEKEGRVPAYYTSATQTTVYRTGPINVQNDWVKWTGGGYRLPTEAEWEKAARGGSNGQRFPWGNTITHSQANYYSYWSGGVPYYPYDVNPTSGYHPTFATGNTPYTSPVNFFPANGYGLHDMAGNVWEWCWDWYAGSYYGSSPTNDPKGPTTGSDRVLRGGGWYGIARYCRAADRIYYYPADWNYYLGFRSVLSPGQ